MGDTERLNWLEAQECSVSMGWHGKPEPTFHVESYSTGAYGRGGTLREAIDAAQAAPEGEGDDPDA